MTDMIAWLRAQLDEDERAARACRHQTWTLDGGSIHGGHETEPIVDWVYDDAWEHIARHDPGSALADIAAKRAILDNATGDGDIRDLEYGEVKGLGIAVRWIAYAYRHRPGYLPEWAPEGAA